jgi:hypothetical protein
MAITIHDPITQQELLTFIIKANGKAEHGTGTHDDCVVALALACITRMPWPLPAQGERPRLEVSSYLHPPSSESDRKGDACQIPATAVTLVARLAPASSPSGARMPARSLSEKSFLELHVVAL